MRDCSHLESNLAETTVPQPVIHQIRELTEADSTVYRRFLNGIDAADLSRRTHGGVAQISDAGIAQLLAPTSRWGTAYGAFDHDAYLIGVVRMAAVDDPRSREIALLVRSDRQRRGVGNALLAYVTRRAVALGVTSLEAHAQPDNAGFEQLARRHGFLGSWDAAERVNRYVLQIAPTHRRSSETGDAATA